MTKSADISSKRLATLFPNAWAQWLTDDESVTALEQLSGDFQWVNRSNDILLKAKSEAHGEFLILNEVQFRPDPAMPIRMRAYTALAEEKYRLNVYPVVVNILKENVSASSVSQYHSEFMGLMAHQDFKVINLWEIDVEIVFEQKFNALLPFAPAMKGGGNEDILRKVVVRLRADETLAEMEALLSFLAGFVLSPEKVKEFTRWDMTILQESPWYNEIIDEGVKQGVKQEREQSLLRILSHRFGSLSDTLKRKIQSLSGDRLEELEIVALDADSLTAVSDYLATV